MVTTSRVIVVLRSELGKQLSLAQKEEKLFKDLTAGEIERCAKGGPITKEINEWLSVKHRCSRIEKTIQALGSLQLGDIEDIDMF